MKSEEGFSNMLDKKILINCLNENVRLISVIKKFKNTREIKRSGGFFT